MTKIEICCLIKNFNKLAGITAYSENTIDFIHEPSSAILCTCSFCANELKEYLSKTDHNIHCVFVDKMPKSKMSIILECLSNSQGDGGFSFIMKKKNQLIIRSSDRNGLVNGTYEFLRLQGWRWLEPGTMGEFMPEQHPVIFPEKNQDFKPSFKYRAFYFEYSSQASVDFLMWMAHNRMNVFGSFPELKPLAQKLGMYILSGGHVITKMLSPQRIMASGKMLIEEHPEWYGVRPDGQKVTIANAQRTQFCCSNAELMDFLADELISRLNHEWLGTDILEVSGFDTWGSTCQCTKCRKYADSDKYLLFMSALRERINKAYKSGKLIHNPMLNTWAYEGTATMEAPSHIPENMVKAHDNCIAFVIKRCYRHVMGSGKDCPVNAKYAKTFLNWGKFGRKMVLWGGEYYNVSRHEDLPLLFTGNMKDSMQFYYKAGARGITYMHTPIINWGVRGITQGLHAALGWDVNTDTTAFCEEFLNLRFGKFSDMAKVAYSEIEKASLDVAEWRSWGTSILTKFQNFSRTGKILESLPCRHYQDNAEVILGGHKIAAHYRKAARIIGAVLDKVNDEYKPASNQELAVNPEEASRIRTVLRQFHFLECELRLLNYAIDVITLMTDCAEAYIAIQQKHYKKVNRFRLKLEKQAKTMRLYTESVSYRAYVPHFETRTALERSQCESFIRMLRNVRPATEREKV